MGDDLGSVCDNYDVLLCVLIFIVVVSASNSVKLTVFLTLF